MSSNRSYGKKMLQVTSVKIKIIGQFWDSFSVLRIKYKYRVTNLNPLVEFLVTLSRDILEGIK